MSEEKPAKSLKSWIFTGVKIAFFMAAFVMIALTILANMGGNGDSLRGAVEQFASSVTGYPAKIEKFNGMTFFPRISADLEDINFYEDEPGLGDPVAHIDKAQLAFDFWDVLFHNGKLLVFDVENISASKEVFTKEKLDIKFLRVADTGGGNAVLEGEGMVGKTPVSMQIGMKTYQSGGVKAFGFGEARDFSITLGKRKIQAVVRDSRSGVLLEDLHIENGAQEATGMLKITEADENISSFEGALKSGDREYTQNFSIDFNKSRAEIFTAFRQQAETFKMESGNTAPLDFINALDDLFGSAKPGSAP